MVVSTRKYVRTVPGVFGLLAFGSCIAMSGLAHGGWSTGRSTDVFSDSVKSAARGMSANGEGGIFIECSGPDDLQVQFLTESERTDDDSSTVSLLTGRLILQVDGQRTEGSAYGRRYDSDFIGMVVEDITVATAILDELGGVRSDIVIGFDVSFFGQPLPTGSYILPIEGAAESIAELKRLCGI